MFAPAHGVAEDAATGSAAGPLAVHLARHGRIAFGEQIEISQGVEIGRPSTLYAQADGTADRIERVDGRRLGRRRRPRRVQASLSSTDDDLRQLDGERGPEDAAVARQVEPVARRVDGDVGVVRRRSRPRGRREPATRLAPRHAGVVGDDERRLRVDDREDRRARRGGGDEARQVERGGAATRDVAVPRLDLVGLEVDGEGARDGLDERDHRASSEATTAVARRAAPTGAKPALRATTYAVANASPAPGRVAGECARGRAPACRRSRRSNRGSRA